MHIRDWRSDVCSSDLALLQVHEHSAVDEQRGAGDIGGHVGGEEDDRADQVLGLAEAAERGARFHISALVRVGEVVLVDLGQDRAGQYAVAADAMAAERDRGRLHQRMYPRLSRRIMGLILAADERREDRKSTSLNYSN